MSKHFTKPELGKKFEITREEAQTAYRIPAQKAYRIPAQEAFRDSPGRRAGATLQDLERIASDDAPERLAKIRRRAERNAKKLIRDLMRSRINEQAQD
jgi:hypothetical protein